MKMHAWCRPVCAIALMLAAGQTLRADDASATQPAPTTAPTDADSQPDKDAGPRDDANFELLSAIDERGATIKTFLAAFVQEKHALLLRKPIVSKGVVRMADGIVRWDTNAPRRTVMTVTAGRIELLFVEQRLLEVYELGDKLASLFQSPVPRLALLREHFAIQQVRDADTKPASDESPSATPAADSEDEGDDATDRDAAPATITLKLLPRDETLKERIEQVVVTLDVKGAFARRIEITDIDGERTVLTFTKVMPNATIDESLAIDPPANTRIVHPMQVSDDR